MTELIVDKEWLVNGEEPDWLREFRRVQIHIENALEYNSGTILLQDIIDQIATGEMHLWAGKDSAIITQFVTFPRKKALHVPFAGGNLAEMEEMAPYVRLFAKTAKCDMVTVAGRKGWERTFLKGFDFKPIYTVFKMDVNYG